MVQTWIEAVGHIATTAGLNVCTNAYPPRLKYEYSLNISLGAQLF